MTRTSRYDYDTQAQVRQAFWGMFDELREKAQARFGRDPIHVRQNKHDATTRSAFVDFVDNLQRDGLISERLADTVTL